MEEISQEESLVQIVSEETSKRITSLRFLLIVFVVFIHNYYTEAKIAESVANGGKFILLNENAIAYWIKLLIQGIARCAVPLFFLFAAYFQSIKNKSYKELLKNKAKSLLAPFIIWSGIYILYYAGVKLLILKIAPNLLANPDSTVLSWTPLDWLHKVIGYGKDGNPEVAYQFWFIRDLIILIIVSPFLNFFIKKIPFAFLSLLFVVYFSSSNIYFVSNQAFFYYSVGLFWGIYKIRVFDKLDEIKWWEIVALFLLTFIISNINEKYGKLNKYYILFASIMLLRFSKILIKKEKMFKLLNYFAGFSFFLFAIHAPALDALLKNIWLHFFPMKNSFFSLFEYFGVVLLDVIIGTSIGILLKKYCFPLFKLLNGGRY